MACVLLLPCAPPAVALMDPAYGNNRKLQRRMTRRPRLVGCGTAQIQAILAAYWNLGNHD